MAQDDEGKPITLHLIWQVYHMPIILGILSLLFIILSITIFIKSYQQVTPISFRSDEQVASDSGAQTPAETMILVDIEGAVENPGVYRLPSGSRVDDLLGAAGGFTDNVDRESVARSVNRAAKLSDGAKVYIPQVGEQTNNTDGASLSDTLSTLSAMSVNVNSASQFELEALSGVGPVTAGKIINGRPYMRLEELVDKKAMSQSLFDKLKSQLTL